MYQNEQLAWMALGRLMTYETEPLKVGRLDEVGAKRYNKTANTPGQPVFDLQQVLCYVAPDKMKGGADGAFGHNTAAALQHVTEKQEFVPSRDLLLLTGLISKKVIDVLASPSEPKATDAIKPFDGEILPTMMVTPLPMHFSQGDPRWKDEKMGVDLTFRRGGCGICCMAMLFNWMSLRKSSGDSSVINPVDVDHWMDNNDGYLSGTNLIVWKNMEGFVRDTLEEEVVYQQDGNRDAPLPHEEGMARARDYLTRRNQPVILRVQNRQFNGGNWFNHFVLGVGIKENGVIAFLDPRNSVGGDLDHPQNDTDQSVNKGGYNVVGVEQYMLKSLL